MRGAMLYVNAGKGHYIPAVALAESFNNAGHSAIVEDLFIVMGTPFWEWFCKYDWRFLLHHPRLEGVVHSFTDTSLSAFFIKTVCARRRGLTVLRGGKRRFTFFVDICAQIRYYKK